MIPPDLKQCQAEVPTGGPFQLGGPSGKPRNGYRIRCCNKPVSLATEKKPGDDGQTGSMSLCLSCRDAMVRQTGGTYQVTPIEPEAS